MVCACTPSSHSNAAAGSTLRQELNSWNNNKPSQQPTMSHQSNVSNDRERQLEAGQGSRVDKDKELLQLSQLLTNNLNNAFRRLREKAASTEHHKRYTTRKEINTGLQTELAGLNTAPQQGFGSMPETMEYKPRKPAEQVVEQDDGPKPTYKSWKYV